MKCIQLVQNLKDFLVRVSSLKFSPFLQDYHKIMVEIWTLQNKITNTIVLNNQRILICNYLSSGKHQKHIQHDYLNFFICNLLFYVVVVIVFVFLMIIIFHRVYCHHQIFLKYFKNGYTNQIKFYSMWMMLKTKIR